MTPRPRTIHLAPAAIQRIKAQSEYYAVRSGDALARRWRFAVNQAIRSLRTSPERGTLIPFRQTSLRDIRSLPIEGFPKHLVLYRLDQHPPQISIVLVIHTAQDVETTVAASHGQRP